MKDSSNSDQPQPRVVDGRGYDFFIVDNPVIDQRIENIEAKRRADAGWTYTCLCRLADNKNGEATLTISYLEKKTGRSRPILIDALKALRNENLIHVRRNHDEQGHQTAPTYVILKVARVNNDDSGPDARVNISPDPELTDLTASTKTHPTKTVTSTDVDVSENGHHDEDPEIVLLQKYITDLLYNASRDRLGIRWSKDEYGYHLGRAKEMVEKDSPTQEEIEELPAAYVDVHGFKGIKADAVEALKDIRTRNNMDRVQAEKKAEKERRRQEMADEAPPWERKNPHGPEEPMDPEAYAREQARREKVAEMLRSAK